mgnify:FL=1
MIAYTYIEKGKFALVEKPKPTLIEAGKIDTTPLITHRFPLSEIEEAYRIFENKLDGVIKVAIV